MDDIDSLLSEAGNRNIKLWVEGDALRFQCAPAAMSDEFRANLKNRRNEIISALKTRRVGRSSGSTTPKFAVIGHDEIVPVIDYHRIRWGYMKSESANLKFSNATHAVFVVRGGVDVRILQQSVDFLLSRHTILKARVVDRPDGPVFVFDRECVVKVEFWDVSDADEEEREALARDLASSVVWRPFGQRSEPWFRVFVVKLGPGEHVIGFVIHHFIADAVSVNIAVHELFVGYTSFENGREPAFPPLPLQYSDCVASINQWLQCGNAEPHVLYWRQHLAGAPPTLLPPDVEPQPDDVGYERTYAFDLPDAAVKRLRGSTKSNNIALLSNLLVTLATSLALLGKTDDITIQTRVFGRLDPRLMTLIGAFFDAMALRIKVSPSATFAELVEQARQVYVNGAAHQALSYHLVKSILPEIGASDISPTLNFFNSYSERGAKLIDDQKTRRFEINPAPPTLHTAGGHSNFLIKVVHDRSGMHVTVEYLDLRYREDTIRRFADTFCYVFERMTANSNDPVSSLVLR